MRRASCLVVTAVLSFVALSAFSAKVASADAGTDSGIVTTPSPNNPVVGQDAGGDAGSTEPDDSGGCNVVTSRGDSGIAALGLGVAAGIFVLSRRRRAKR